MTSKQALIIEDDRELAEIFAEILQLDGINTEIVMDGQLALDKLAETAPSIVLLDLHLPHVNGVDILKFIRGDIRLRDINVVIITAAPQTLEGIGLKVDLVLVKPVDYAEISSLISHLK